MPDKKSKQRIDKVIARKIIHNIPSATGWIMESLLFMGELTIQSFLSPSLYADMPSGKFSFESKASTKSIKYKEETIRQSIRRLARQGFVKKNENKYALTRKGQELIKKIFQKKNSINQKWDKKYRLVIFDIPEKNRKIRNWLRNELYLLEYKQLQKSVFIGKHPLPEELIKDIKKLKIGNNVNYVLAERVYQNVFRHTTLVDDRQLM